MKKVLMLDCRNVEPILVCSNLESLRLLFDFFIISERYITLASEEFFSTCHVVWGGEGRYCSYAEKEILGNFGCNYMFYASSAYYMESNELNPSRKIFADASSDKARHALTFARELEKAGVEVEFFLCTPLASVYIRNCQNLDYLKLAIMYWLNTSIIGEKEIKNADSIVITPPKEATFEQIVEVAENVLREADEKSNLAEAS